MCVVHKLLCTYVYIIIIYMTSPNEMNHMCKFETIELSVSLESADIKLSYDIISGHCSLIVEVMLQ